MFVNNVVKELLGGLENAGGRDDVKGTRILRGFFNNKRVGGLVDRLLAGDEQLTGTSAVLADATKVRSERACKLLRNGQRSGASASDWVMVRISDQEYGGVNERELEKGGFVAPVQLWTSGATELQGHETVPKDKSRRRFLTIHERCAVEKKEEQYSLASLAVCQRGGCAGASGGCREPERHQSRVALELVV